LTAARPTSRRAEREAHIPAGEHRESGGWVHVFVEAELPAVEIDCCVDVVDDVADADFGHEASSP
jgi:hypothetical protein